MAHTGGQSQGRGYGGALGAARRPCAVGFAALCCAVVPCCCLSSSCAAAAARFSMCRCQVRSFQGVVKLVAFRFNDPSLDNFSGSIVAGLNASLHSRKFTAADGVRAEIAYKSATFTTYPSELSAALKDRRTHAVVGHCGDKLLESVKDVLA
ncbi:receptor-type adenylate cyclase [Trypanosoma rangeli]|uniref:Receptor-type adenylate cyclase n=1 Tax=Trypanosoma rangeli TaxID=5698 RepID=A0A3R7KE19_TRYRA|nr:receptor-type adenylate cyclase [Trypanosoma rangeli]RNE98639.1 receptor-type adenylate cyclase [Trypanosoma rangeli]|eukprot:RNE98639.1 receptor-type adenylate cyclase [Trypanosoma rangeli]